jgi:hypothetical protein
MHILCYIINAFVNLFIYLLFVCTMDKYASTSFVAIGGFVSLMSVLIIIFLIKLKKIVLN